MIELPSPLQPYVPHQVPPVRNPTDPTQDDGKVRVPPLKPL